jgi:hypothetical protein
MNVSCPRCGKDNTEGFFDKTLKTQGYHCDDCNLDFGVDDGKIFADHEKLLNDFSYQRTGKDGTIRQIYIHQVLDKITLAPSLVKKGILTPFETLDITEEWEDLKHLFFEKLFLLDWPDSLAGIITGKEDESYEIRMKFSMNLIPEIRKTGTDQFPPYLKVLDQLFAPFFEEEPHESV